MNREDKATLKPIKEDQEYALGLLLDVDGDQTYSDKRYCLGWGDFLDEFKEGPIGFFWFFLLVPVSSSFNEC